MESYGLHIRSCPHPGPVDMGGTPRARTHRPPSTVNRLRSTVRRLPSTVHRLPVIVCKFGGTSVADAAAIRRLVAIVEGRAAERPLVVVSALAGVTDGLLRLATAVHAGDAQALDDGIDALVRRHGAVAGELPGAHSTGDSIRKDTEPLRSSLASAFGRRLRPAEIDELVGYGELWSSRLVAGALSGAGIPAAWAD